jgi:hypothetical protein
LIGAVHDVAPDRGWVDPAAPAWRSDRNWAGDCGMAAPRFAQAEANVTP